MRRKRGSQALWVEMKRLAFYLEAGLDILSALRQLGGVWESVRLSVLEGGTLREALRAGGKYFPAGMELRLGAAQDNGRLAEELMKIGVELERAQKWRSKLVGVLLYPCMVALLTVVLTLVLWIWWVPKLERMLEATAVGGPQMAASASSSAGGNWLLWAGCGVLGGSLIWGVQKKWLSGGGGVASAWQQRRTARMLSGLLQAGLSLPAALNQASGLVRGERGRRRWADGIVRIEAGESFSKVAIESKWWSRDYAGVLSTGEQTGRTAEVLEEMASWLEDEIERKCQRLLILTEPVLLLVIAAMVLWVVSRFVGPLMQMMEAGGL